MNFMTDLILIEILKYCNYLLLENKDEVNELFDILLTNTTRI